MTADTILLVDDDNDFCQLIADDLGSRDMRVVTCSKPDNARAMLKTDENIDVLLTDLNLGRDNGIDLCRWCVSNRPDVPVIVITAFGSLDSAVQAIRAGAYDFISKPADTDLIHIGLKRAIEHRRLREQLTRLSDVANGRASEELTGESEPIAKLRSTIHRLSGISSSVLVTGESGTGKEVVARLLHKNSPRCDKPFIDVNCAAMPETLLESELFGHKRGAFTGATADRDGLFVYADGGTVFLDEIGEMAPALQAKLLRAIEVQRVRPLGGNDEIGFDVRIIAATNKDLETAVEGDQFREDLYYRLNVIHLHVPPLRARGTDVLLLANHFAQEFARKLDRKVTGITEPAARALVAYSWPGNVRELRNAIERAVAFARYDQITVDDLPNRVRIPKTTHNNNAIDFEALLPLAELEKRYINYVLEQSDGNRSQAARILGFDRRTLYRKLEAFEEEE